MNLYQYDWSLFVHFSKFLTGRGCREAVACKSEEAEPSATGANTSQIHNHQSQSETLSSHFTPNTKGYIVFNNHLFIDEQYQFASDNKYFNNMENDSKLFEMLQKVQNNLSNIQHMMDNTNNNNNNNNDNNTNSNANINNNACGKNLDPTGTTGHNDEQKKRRVKKNEKISRLSSDGDTNIDVNSNNNNNNNKAKKHNKQTPSSDNRLTESLSMFTNDELLRGSKYYCKQCKRKVISCKHLSMTTYMTCVLMW